MASAKVSLFTAPDDESTPASAVFRLRGLLAGDSARTATVVVVTVVVLE